jgi:uncharacterized protein (DUF697 family)
MTHLALDFFGLLLEVLPKEGTRRKPKEGMMIRLFSPTDPASGPIVACRESDRQTEPPQDNHCRQSAHMEEKRQAAKRLIRMYARLAAANSLNPIPGLDVGIDAGILAALHHSITANYGLAKEQAQTLGKKPKPQGYLFPVLQSITERFGSTLTRDAIAAILKRLGAECVARETTKWFPVVGTVISATVGYQITYRFGEKVLEDCECAARGNARVEQLSKAA